MAAQEDIQTGKPVVVSYNDLVNAPLSLQSEIEKAFGSDSDCLGLLIIRNLPPEYARYRERLLRLSDKFASLDESTREKYAHAGSRYSFGWSHGKEIMNGQPDTLKGSYYANPVIDAPTVSTALREQHPEYYGNNIWPDKSEKGVEGFEEAFKDLGGFIFNVGRRVTDACQPFVSSKLADATINLADLIGKSQTTKARLLHYFPPSEENPLPADDEPIDSWCGFHLDHSVITGLCSALYLSHEKSGQPTAVQPPSPASGLYIRTRGGNLVKAVIPADCLAFQTGEALQIATRGKLRATPHCVRVGAGPGAEHVSRETFALFMQPNTDQLIGEAETFGSFSHKIFQEHYKEEPATITANA